MRTTLAHERPVTAEPERRKDRDRRTGRDRRSPSGSIDVTRIEHENLLEEVDQLIRLLRRMEQRLEEQDRRVAAMEKQLKAPRAARR